MNIKNKFLMNIRKKLDKGGSDVKYNRSNRSETS